MNIAVELISVVVGGGGRKERRKLFLSMYHERMKKAAARGYAAGITALTIRAYKTNLSANCQRKGTYSSCGFRGSNE